MPGERFIDRLIADTLSERYRPCEESGDMPGQGAVDMIMEAYPLDATVVNHEDNLHRKLQERLKQPIYLTLLSPEELDLIEFNRSHSLLSRLGDWFAGFFAIDPTIAID